MSRKGSGWINWSGSMGYSIQLKDRGYILGVINPHKILTFDPNPPGTCFLPGDIFMVWQVFKKVELHHPHRPNDDPNLRHLIASVCLTRWWFQIFFIFTPKFGEDSHFDEHIFQMGWFNHQPVKQVKCCLN